MNDSKKTAPKIEPFSDILGLDIAPNQLEKNLAVYVGILGEIQKLRSLKLTEVHPAVVFESKNFEEQKDE